MKKQYNLTYLKFLFLSFIFFGCQSNSDKPINLITIKLKYDEFWNLQSSHC